MTILIRLLKWSLTVITVITLLIFSYINFVIWRFDAENLPANHGGVKTELFLSEGKNQPLVVGFGGADGGNAWAGEHAAKQRVLLREQGYAFLALGYFGMEGTPALLDRIDIEGIHKAIMLAAAHPEINGECIAIMGVSKGGELALLLGSEYQEYKSVIGIVPGNAVFSAITKAMNTASFSKKGVPYAFVPVPWSATFNLLTGDLHGAFEKMLYDTDAVQQAAIKVENINGSVLLISGTQDEQWPSKQMSDDMIERLANAGFKHKYIHIPLEGGHFEHFEHFDKVTNFLNLNLRSELNTNCQRD